MFSHGGRRQPSYPDPQIGTSVITSCQGFGVDIAKTVVESCVCLSVGIVREELPTEEFIQQENWKKPQHIHQPALLCKYSTALCLNQGSKLTDKIIQLFVYPVIFIHFSVNCFSAILFYQYLLISELFFMKLTQNGS